MTQQNGGSRRPREGFGCLSMLFIVIVAFITGHQVARGGLEIKGVACKLFGMLGDPPVHRVQAKNAAGTTTWGPAPKPEPWRDEKGRFRTSTFACTTPWAWWSYKRTPGSLQYSTNELGTEAIGTHLFVSVTLENVSKEPEYLPRFVLVDEEDREFEPASIGVLEPEGLGVLERLNPSTERKGIMAFKILDSRTYKLVMKERGSRVEMPITIVKR
jgi:hypothetical protein